MTDTEPIFGLIEPINGSSVQGLITSDPQESFRVEVHNRDHSNAAVCEIESWPRPVRDIYIPDLHIVTLQGEGEKLSETIIEF